MEPLHFKHICFTSRNIATEYKKTNNPEIEYVKVYWWGKICVSIIMHIIAKIPIMHKTVIVNLLRLIFDKNQPVRKYVVTPP